MADSYQQRNQQSRGSALAMNIMGRNSQRQSGAGVGAQQVVVAGFNDQVLGSINANLQAIYSMLADGLKKDKEDLRSKQNAAVQSRSQVRKREEGQGLGSAIGGGIKKIGNIAKQVTNFGGILDGLINGFLAILGGWLAGKLPEIIKGIKKGWEKVGPFITKVFDAMWKAIKWTFNFIVKVIKGVIDFLVKGFEFIGNQIKKFINFIYPIAENAFKTVKKMIDFVNNIRKKITNVFGAVAGFLGFGDSEDKTEKVSSSSSGRKTRRNKRNKKNINYEEKLEDALERKKIYEETGDIEKLKGVQKKIEFYEKMIEEGNSANITNKSNVVGDMKGQGNMKKNPVIQPKALTGKSFTQEQGDNAVAVNSKEFNIESSENVYSTYVEPDKAKHDKKIAQQKPRFEPTFVIPPLPSVDVGGNIPSGPNPRPRSGKSTKSKSIPSNNPRNFYTLFSAIQYNCTAHF